MVRINKRALEYKENDFNAMLEGSAYDRKWEELTFKPIKLNIPGNAIILEDDSFKYKLYGTTLDFKTIKKVEGEGLEVTIHFSGVMDILEIPRLIFMKDGRIYLNDSIIHDPSYLTYVIPLVLEKGRELFK